MPFISYAQNFEDLMLWRALRGVEGGFYIDIGAMSPTYDSVTRAFYDRGWRGLNIEPNAVYLEQLRQQRPLDLNLGIAVSDRRGTLDMHVLDVPGLSTLDQNIARAHEERGIAGHIVQVETRTLAEIWAEFVPDAQEVHFLKVDVEGSEKDVLRGNNWARFRPWIVVLEATFPNTQRQVHAEWEEVLIGAGYRDAYWDGLNKFYVANEHSHLSGAFSSPPNVFDDFELFRYTEQIGLLSEQKGSLNEYVNFLLKDAQEQKSRIEAVGVDLELNKSALAATEKELELSKSVLAVSDKELELSKSVLAATEFELRESRNKLSELERLLAVEKSSSNCLRGEISVMRSKLTWRATQPFRSAGDALTSALARLFC